MNDWQKEIIPQKDFVIVDKKSKDYMKFFGKWIITERVFEKKTLGMFHPSIKEETIVGMTIIFTEDYILNDEYIFKTIRYGAVQQPFSTSFVGNLYPYPTVGVSSSFKVYILCSLSPSLLYLSYR